MNYLSNYVPDYQDLTIEDVYKNLIKAISDIALEDCNKHIFYSSLGNINYLNRISNFKFEGNALHWQQQHTFGLRFVDLLDVQVIVHHNKLFVDAHTDINNIAIIQEIARYLDKFIFDLQNANKLLNLYLKGVIE